jgi:dGTP triphosphohydrolase
LGGLFHWGLIIGHDTFEVVVPPLQGHHGSLGSSGSNRSNRSSGSSGSSRATSSSASRKKGRKNSILSGKADQYVVGPGGLVSSSAPSPVDVERARLPKDFGGVINLRATTSKTDAQIKAFICDWVHSNPKYNLFSANCQDFVEALFQFCTGEKFMYTKDATKFGAWWRSWFGSWDLFRPAHRSIDITWN